MCLDSGFRVIQVSSSRISRGLNICLLSFAGEHNVYNKHTFHEDQKMLKYLENLKDK
jgi:hypothetical protein